MARRGSKSESQVRNDLRGLKQRFDTAREVYEELRDQCEERVVRWEWATAPRYHLDPLNFLDEEATLGRIISPPPRVPDGRVAYGYSHENRIVLERQFFEDLPGRYYQTFFVYSLDRTLGYHFHYDPTQGCINCAQLVFAASSPAYYQQWAILGWRSQTYITSGNQIRAFVGVFKDDDDAEERFSGELKYRDDGQIELWTRWSGEAKAQLTFRGVPPENPFLRSQK